jgi:hypothetical protein
MRERIIYKTASRVSLRFTRATRRRVKLGRNADRRHLSVKPILLLG